MGRRYLKRKVGMAEECGVVLKVVEPIRSFVFDAIGKYVGYIGSCEDNLGALRKSLSEVCDKKDGIKKKVKEGNDKQEEITREAASWLKDVRILTEDEELKGLMYKDVETAKFVVKMMGKRHLKKRISEESEMQELVVNVMKKLREEMDKSEEEMRKIAEVDYKQVAEVVVEVMKDTIDEFKKLLKEDKKMTVIATRMLKDSDLDKLTKGDQEMEEIVRKAGYASDEELLPNYEDGESNALQPLLVKIPEVSVGKNSVKEAAKKLFTPLANLVTPLGKLMDDGNFKKAVPEAEGVKLGLEVIDGLLIKGRGLKKEKHGSTKQQRGCCCSSLSLCDDYHGRYLVSKAAEFMAKHIQDELISKCPRDPVTLRIRTVDLKLIPTQFLKGLDSRTKLLHRILGSLNDDQVDAIGLFGMGGTGKTTLAKEVNKRITDMFSIKVMVEVSDSPDIVGIQTAIAESIDLPLHDVESVSQRAIRLYNRLISEEKNKVLIILDNVWKKIDLDEIGISRSCKILLTTRDRDVCRVMGVQDVNILEVGVMDTNESRELFKSRAGNQVDKGEYKNVVQRLLSKCGGLPLAIVATANSLKDKDLPIWEKFAHDLEKPLSSQITGNYHRTYSILNTSYKFIENHEKKMFFLLVCLSPIGSSASIETLMRYGIGLGLFQHVNKLREAFEQAATWANDLVQSSMLLEGDDKGDVKIHDIVRAFAISFAAKEEGHKFMVEDIPRWMEDETFKSLTAMSLVSRNDYSRLSGVDASRLQILILKGDHSQNLCDNFFEEMVNLVVLDLSSMNFENSLPKSLWKLKKLKTLCMERCKLGDMKQVGELVNLIVLSLRESFMEELPREIGKLCKLRLFDLSGCICSKMPLIPAGVLGELSKLEGLYMFNQGQAVLETEPDDQINATENNRLPYLNVFEIKVQETEVLPIDGQSIENVDDFRVLVGTCKTAVEKAQPFCRVLQFLDVDDVCGFLEKTCLKVLLKKAELLEFLNCNNFKHLSPQLDQEGFRDLKSLDVSFCDDIKCIVDGNARNNLIAFPCLQSLRLDTMENIQMVYNGEAPRGSFSNLQTLDLSYLENLLYALPLVPRNLNEICVSHCRMLKFLFTENEETQVIELPFLKKLQLLYSTCLLSLIGPKGLSNTSDSSREPERQIFFDGKLVLPALEQLELVACTNTVKLWSNDIYGCGFHNLKNIKIQLCGKLSCVGSSYVFSILVQLESLSIKHCKEMREIISSEETEESEIGEKIIKFPQLKYLELGDLTKLESFYDGDSKLEFPKLKKLELYNLECMNRFSKLEDSSALFHQTIDFPCLEELHVKSLNDNVMGLWGDSQALSVASNPAPMLRRLTLGRTAGLRHIPSVILENLLSVTLAHFIYDGALFASSDSGEKEGFVVTYSQLSNLEELKVDSSHSLKELFENEGDCNASLRLFCEQVKTLELKFLLSLNLVPLHLFKGLTSLTLHALKWEYVISADALGNSLDQLQFLSIDNCDDMEVLVLNVDLRIELPRLKRLILRSLRSVVSFSSVPEREATLLLPSLESLEITRCRKVEHFWSGSIVAPNLQDVTLDDCVNLQQFLIGNPEDIIELPSLQKVCIKQCLNIKSISSGPLIAPKLREVELYSCESMQCFFPGNPNHNGDLQLPSLEIVSIALCCNLQSFSLTRLLAPKLTHIRYDGDRYSMLQVDDLNKFLQKIYAESMLDYDAEEDDLDKDDDDDEEILSENDDDLANH